MWHEALKRLFDIVCASLGLLVLAPVGLLIGLSIKLADRGPVFFSQTRIGQFGRPFRIWKFRSMVVNAEQIGAPLTSKDDPRITGLGRLLRKTRLDELPQLWNVLVGDMSWVGPRPEVPCYVDLYTPQQRDILKHRPGITDVASLLFRNEEQLLRGAVDLEGFYQLYCLPKKLKLNLQYAERATLLQDLWIVFQTLIPYWLGVLGFYCLSLTFSFWLSYELRSDFRATDQNYEEFRQFLLLIVFPQLILLFWRGQLRGFVSYFSIPEMRSMIIALAMALLLQVALCYPLQGRLVPTHGILLLDFVLSLFTLCGFRMAFRLLRERFSRSCPACRAPTRRVALIGTGELATRLLLDSTPSGNPARRVVAFFDDNPATWHTRFNNIPVMGMPECLLRQEWLQQIDEVVVALPEENSARIREIGEMLKGLPLKVTIAYSVASS
jgi:lipopolysaccharide/colanic/teichoic acid biosynthesis glycosyltransferase